MKPISLMIDGINSFYDRQTVDFDFDGLFCISGDTGSGKTTILDCIIIALFGSGKRASVLGDYINLKRDKAEIKLIFETVYEGERHTFEVTRTLVRDGASRAKLLDLTSGETLAEQTAAVNSLLEGMIGLTRDDFTQVVILEQGKFAKFLTASKKERNETVGNLFKLNKYRELGSKFGSRMKEVKRDIDSLDERLTELKGTTLVSVTEKERRIKANEKRIAVLTESEKRFSNELAQLEKQKSKYDKSIEAKKKLEKESKNAEELKNKLAELTEKYDSNAKELSKITIEKKTCELTAARASDFLSLIAERDKRNAALERLRAEWKDASDAEAKCRADLALSREKYNCAKASLERLKNEIFSIADLGEKSEYFDVFDIRSEVEKWSVELKRAKADHAELDKKVKELTARNEFNKKSLLEVMEKQRIAEARRDELKKEADELRIKREKRQRDEAALFVKSGLKKGDRCPVCGNLVQDEIELVVHEDDLSLEQKETELSNIEKECRLIENNKYSFGTRLDESGKALSEAQDRLKEAEARLSKANEIIKMPDRADELVELTRSAVETKKQLGFLESELGVLEQKLRSAETRTADIKARGEIERNELSALVRTIEDKHISESDLKQNENKLKELSTLEKTLTEKDAFLRSEREKTATLYASSRASADMYAVEAAEMPKFDIKALTDKSEELAGAKNERETLMIALASEKKELEIMQRELEKKRELEKDKSEKKKIYDIFSDIYKLVSGDKFIEYIAEEYILQFTASASIVLGDITGGKYTLEYEGGAFWVGDFLADGTKRKASTLSGGETFLASLSIAIAISREIARYKTYEFFFLDEGFGTLDAYSLDTVMNALTALSADTLVGVVTHRPELTERIFDKITVLSASENRGSVITRSY